MEAECFGSEIVFSQNETPQVGNRLVVSLSGIKRLKVPSMGDYRSKNYIEITKKLLSVDIVKPVIGEIIGPFSLAGRLFGAKEMFKLTIDNGFSALLLIENCDQFLMNFSKVYKEVGCRGMVISEPYAGLLSPKALSKFSSVFIKQLIRRLDSPAFRVFYHNCGARVVHLNSIFETEASIFHFGGPIDISTELQRNKEDRIISGNLDPVSVFLSNEKETVSEKTIDLFNVTRNDSNFLFASGCDLPAETPFENIRRFYSVVHSRENG